MTLNLSENIRLCRREHNLTQEQLAEAMGISVAAVSKWETGASAPELTLLVELAEFFETSVDALLGYGWESRGMGRTLEQLRTFRQEKRYDEGAPFAEKALKKYPNSFEIALAAAKLLAMMGLERRDHRTMQHAIDLYGRACELIGQNTDPKVSEGTLKVDVAMLELAMGRTAEGVELLKQNNPDGMNDDLIGFALAAHLRKADEALPYLGDAFSRIVIAQLYRVVIGCTNALCGEKKQFATALEMIKWLIGVYESLRMPGSAMIDKHLSTLLLCCAEISHELHDEAAARKSMAQALEAARRFDAAPDYHMSGLKFYCGDPGAVYFDDAGESAVEGLRNILEADRVPELVRLWDELVNG